MELILDDLACRRGGRTVFAGLSFRVAQGTAALVRGPNGSGKSSLLRVIAGLLPPSAGEVRLGEIALSRDPGALQERVAFAGHLDAIKPALTVAGNLAAWAGIFGASRGRAEAALASFGLAGIADRPAGQCSAGQRRRLGLARLMVLDRPLWLLDEPTVSLDADSAALVARLVREHAAAGGIALIATHIDLGLGPAPVLAMHGSAAHQDAGADEFLAGHWS
ncbi:MAG TPA: heme ABC exporter ATP-binding protein CcmA [Paracoccaceae bacterium]|nr:heme ABC exporter ATP-binding protein CcmA [Paracoccaceae bacterium]